MNISHRWNKICLWHSNNISFNVFKAGIKKKKNKWIKKTCPARICFLFCLQTEFCVYRTTACARTYAEHQNRYGGKNTQTIRVCECFINVEDFRPTWMLRYDVFAVRFSQTYTNSESVYGLLQPVYCHLNQTKWKPATLRAPGHHPHHWCHWEGYASSHTATLPHKHQFTTSYPLKLC